MSTFEEMNSNKNIKRMEKKLNTIVGINGRMSQVETVIRITSYNNSSYLLPWN